MELTPNAWVPLSGPFTASNGVVVEPLADEESLWRTGLAFDNALASGEYRKFQIGGWRLTHVYRTTMDDEMLSCGEIQAEDGRFCLVRDLGFRNGPGTPESHAAVTEYLSAIEQGLVVVNYRADAPHDLPLRYIPGKDGLDDNLFYTVCERDRKPVIARDGIGPDGGRVSLFTSAAAAAASLESVADAESWRMLLSVRIPADAPVERVGDATVLVDGPIAGWRIGHKAQPVRFEPKAVDRAVHDIAP